MNRCCFASLIAAIALLLLFIQPKKKSRPLSNRGRDEGERSSLTISFLLSAGSVPTKQAGDKTGFSTGRVSAVL